MAKTFFIADLHFGHKNIIEYEHRPFKDIESMDEKMYQNWNNIVSKEDRVFVLGDVSFYDREKTTTIVSGLNGHKNLILGNHDRGWNIDYWYRCGFDFVSKFPIVVDDFLFLSHEPPQYIPQNTPYYYLYGHVHGSEMYKTVTKTSACMSVERWNYKPVEMDELIQLVEAAR